MSQTLYRKYRPQTFAELIGQDQIKLTLENEIKNNRVAHAYLFSGPRGVGKTTTARLMAKVLNCENRKGTEPCNECRACREIMAGRSLDIVEIDAASYTQVDHIRENIIPNARTAPTHNQYKVFIIDEVHMLSLSAFNALLKILEEPPAHVIFILATTEVHKIPETIISRCQRFDFKRVGLGDIKKRLAVLAGQEKIEVDEIVLDQIAASADGSIRDAEGRLGQIFALGEKKVSPEIAALVLPHSDSRSIKELFVLLGQKKTKEAVGFLNKLLDEGLDLKYFIEQFVEFLRKCILFKVDKQLVADLALDYKASSKINFQDLLEVMDITYIKRSLELLIQAKREMNYTSIPQLPLEMAIIEICGQSKEDIPSVSKPSEKREEKKAFVPSEQKSSGEDQAQLKKIAEKWPQLIRLLNEDNHSLALILKSCSPVSYHNDHLVIGCLFPFHQERLKDHKNIGKIEEAIQEIMAQKIAVKFIIHEKPPESPVNSKNEPDKDLNDVIESFGGEVTGS